jgi:integrase
MARPRKIIETPLTPFVAEYLAYFEAGGKSTKSVNQYGSVLRRFAKANPDVGTQDLDGNEGAKLIIRWLNAEFEGKAQESHRGAQVVIGQFTRFLALYDYIAADPMPKVPKVRAATPAPRAAAISVVKAVMAAQNPRDRLLITCSARMGFRIGDVRNARFQDFDLARGVIRVEAGKGGKTAELPMPNDIRLLVEEVLLVDEPKPTDYVLFATFVSNLPHLAGRRFPRPDRRVSEQHAQDWWRECLERAGVLHFRFHMLRHLAGQSIQQTYRNAKATQRIMRHSNAATTLNYYVNADQAELAQALDDVEELWK